MTEQKLKELQEAQGKRLKNSTLIIGLGGLVILVAPYILTRNLGLIDFTTTGAIGDTIGGITAPIVNFMAALLVYYAFRAQIDANNIIFQQFLDEKTEKKVYLNRDYMFKLFDLLKTEFLSITYFDWNQGQKVKTNYYGPEAMDKLIKLELFNNLTGPSIDHLRKINNINSTAFWKKISLFRDFLVEMREIEIPNTDRKFLYNSIHHLYYSQIDPIISEYTNIDNVKKIDPNADPSIFMQLESSIIAEFDVVQRKYKFI